jgi:hypothetical protein
MYRVIIGYLCRSDGQNLQSAREHPHHTNNHPAGSKVSGAVGTTGLYGKNAAETAERLPAQVINELMEKGKLPPQKKGQMERNRLNRTRG